METVAPWMATNNLLGRARYGISHDDPNITAPEKLRYDAAVEVPEDFTGTGPYMKTVIAGGRYASGRFKGTGDQLGAAWESDTARLAARQRDATRCTPVLRVLPYGRVIRPANRSTRVRHLHSSGRTLNAPGAV